MLDKKLVKNILDLNLDEQWEGPEEFDEAVMLYKRLLILLLDYDPVMALDIEILLEKVDMDQLADKLFLPLIDLTKEFSFKLNHDLSQKLLKQAKEFQDRVTGLLQTFEILVYAKHGRFGKENQLMKALNDSLRLLNYRIDVYQRVQSQVEEIRQKSRINTLKSGLN